MVSSPARIGSKIPLHRYDLAMRCDEERRLVLQAMIWLFFNLKASRGQSLATPLADSLFRACKRLTEGGTLSGVGWSPSHRFASSGEHPFLLSIVFAACLPRAASLISGRPPLVADHCSSDGRYALTPVLAMANRDFDAHPSVLLPATVCLPAAIPRRAIPVCNTFSFAFFKKR